MDYLALKTAILANGDCAPYIHTNDPPIVDAITAVQDDNAIAAIFNAELGTRIVECYENAISLMDKLGAITGAVILDKLEAASVSHPVLKWAMLAIKSDRGINVGDQEARAVLSALASDGTLTQAEADSIMALAERSSSLAYETVGQPISGHDVSIALRNY